MATAFFWDVALYSARRRAPRRCTRGRGALEPHVAPHDDEAAAAAGRRRRRRNRHRQRRRGRGREPAARHPPRPRRAQRADRTDDRGHCRCDPFNRSGRLRLWRYDAREEENAARRAAPAELAAHPMPLHFAFAFIVAIAFAFASVRSGRGQGGCGPAAGGPDGRGAGRL